MLYEVLKIWTESLQTIPGYPEEEEAINEAKIRKQEKEIIQLKAMTDA